MSHLSTGAIASHVYYTQTEEEAKIKCEKIYIFAIDFRSIQSNN